MPYHELNVAAPIAKAVRAIGLEWFSPFVELGALIGLMRVILVLLYGQSRIFAAMAADGLLPPLFARVHPTLKTPYVSQLVIGGIIAVVAAMAPIDLLSELVGMGTLFAFILVCAAVIYLRSAEPLTYRPFRVPQVPWLPILGILSCLWPYVGPGAGHLVASRGLAHDRAGRLFLLSPVHSRLIGKS